MTQPAHLTLIQLITYLASSNKETWSAIALWNGMRQDPDP